MWFWCPLKEEIENWVESTEKEFVEQENRNPRIYAKDWLQRYVFSNLHEIIFATFPTKFHAWLSRLAKNKTSNCSDRAAEWTPEVIQRLKWTDIFISRAIDFQMNNLLEGFVTEFTVDTLKSQSEAERYFFKGYRDKYLNSLNLWIKMLLCEQGILRLDA